MDNNEHIAKPPAVLQMRPYQQRWIDDNSRFKIAVKAARVGYSFATAYRRVEMSMRVPGRRRQCSPPRKPNRSNS